MLVYMRCIYHCFFGISPAVHVVAQLIVRDAENPRRQSTGEDLDLIPVAVHQIDIEAVTTVVDDTVCADDIMCSC